jgi:hypothetical protein
VCALTQTRPGLYCEAFVCPSIFRTAATGSSPVSFANTCARLLTRAAACVRGDPEVEHLRARSSPRECDLAPRPRVDGRQPEPHQYRAQPLRLGVRHALASENVMLGEPMKITSATGARSSVLLHQARHSRQHDFAWLCGRYPCVVLGAAGGRFGIYAPHLIPASFARSCMARRVAHSLRATRRRVCIFLLYSI